MGTIRTLVYFAYFFIENLIYNDIKIYNTRERRYFREYSRYLLTYIFISETIRLQLTIKRGITIREWLINGRKPTMETLIMARNIRITVPEEVAAWLEARAIEVTPSELATNAIVEYYEIFVGFFMM